MPIKLDNMTSIPAGVNPFSVDLFRMGTKLNDRYMAMYNDHDGSSNHVILIDLFTGKRVKVTFPAPESKPTNHRDKITVADSDDSDHNINIKA